MTDLSPGAIPRGALIKANNVTFETGLVTKAPGSLKYNTNALSAGIVGLWDWWPDPFTQRLIALTSAGSLYRDIGDKTFSGGTAITTGLLSVTPNAFFVEGGNETAARNKKLFLFTGTNQVKVLSGDGTSFATMSQPAADWVTPNYPTFGFVHRNHLWAFMKQQFYASNTGDHEDFVTSNAILTGSIFPGEGGDLMGGFVFKGRAYVFKKGGFVYYLDDTDTNSTNWLWRKLASNFGLASPHGIAELTNDMVALNESGALISYAAVNTYSGIDSSDLYKIMMIANYLRANTSFSGLNQTHTLYYEEKKQLFITGRKGYRIHNNLLIHIDFNRQQPRPAIWDKDAPDCLALRKDINLIKRPIYGASDGFVYLMDREDRLVGGSAYTGEFKTPHDDFREMDLSLASKNKLYDSLAIEFIPMGNWNITIDVYIDGKFSETLTVPMTVKDNGLGNFQLGSNALGREESQTIYTTLHGAGRRISFHVKGTGSNQNFSLASLTVYFRLSAEQATLL